MRRGVEQLFAENTAPCQAQVNHLDVRYPLAFFHLGQQLDTVSRMYTMFFFQRGLLSTALKIWVCCEISKILDRS